MRIMASRYAARSAPSQYRMKTKDRAGRVGHLQACVGYSSCKCRLMFRRKLKVVTACYNQVGDPLNTMLRDHLRDRLRHRLFDLGGKADRHSIAAMERFLRTGGIHGISRKSLEKVVKHLSCLLVIPRHDPHSEPGFFQAARHRLAHHSGPTDHHDSLLPHLLLLRIVRRDSVDS